MPFILEGEQVYILHPDFEGEATVLCHIFNELYNVQVKLDNPDSDGHQIYRFKLGSEVKSISKKATNTTTKGEYDMNLTESAKIGRSNIDSLNLRKGQPYILTRTYLNRGTHAYVYLATEEHTFLGSYQLTDFVDIEEYSESKLKKALENTQPIEENKDNSIEETNISFDLNVNTAINKETDTENIKEHNSVETEQLSLF